MLYLSCSILVYTLIPLQSNFAFHGFGYREIGPHSSPNYVYFVHVYVVSRTRRRRCRRRRQRLRQPPLVGKLSTMYFNVSHSFFFSFELNFTSMQDESEWNKNGSPNENGPTKLACKL